MMDNVFFAIALFVFALLTVGGFVNTFWKIGRTQKDLYGQESQDIRKTLSRH